VAERESCCAGDRQHSDCHENVFEEGHQS
jgi:hypothetical protein